MLMSVGNYCVLIPPVNGTESVSGVESADHMCLEICLEWSGLGSSYNG